LREGGDMSWRFLRWASEVAGGFCAAFLAFGAALGAIGFPIALAFNAEASCWPQHSTFFVFRWSCDSAVAGAAWFGTVALARVVVALPALSLHYIQDTIRDWPNHSYVFESITWTATVLTLLGVWVGFRHLRERARALAWGLLAVFIAQAVVLATPVDMGSPVQSACAKADYYLSAMHEPPLSCGASPDDESYRFLWLRSFDDPVAIRVYRRGGQYGLVAVVLEYRTGADLGGVKKRLDKVLSVAEWRQAVSMLEAVDFWRMKTNPDDMIGIDGAGWIVEGRRMGRYYIANRLGGLELEPVGKLFLKLVDLGDVGPVY
jgi:hypothetical protein